MKSFFVVFGALLLAAPAFSLDDAILTFSLHETRQKVSARMGPPALIIPAGALESWQYQEGIEDHHEFSHQLVFRGDALISVTRNFEAPTDLSALFPPAETRAEHYPDAQHPAMSFHVRRIGKNVLLALGSPSATQQVMLIRAAELRNFHPWLADRLMRE